jgi:hypothetical protein
MDAPTLAIVASIVLGVVSLFGKYAYDLRLARRKDALELVNRRLNEFYGPLYVSSRAGRLAFDALKQRLGQDCVFKDRAVPTKGELEEWKVWLPSVLMPINEFMEQLILKNSHLIRENEFPLCLAQFVAHVAAYKAVLKQWESKEYRDVLSTIDFPREVESYAEESYVELKAEQARLLGRDT